MTKDQKINMLRHMLDDDDTDPFILETYLELAGQKVLNRMYPFKDNYDGLEVPDRYVGIQLKIGCYLYLKQGAYGQIQHIENNIHRNWGASDIPDEMVADIVPYCQAIR